MTGRERVLAVARGGEVDRIPTVATFGAGAADAIAVPLDDLAKTIDANPDSAVLATILSPLGRAIRDSVNIVSELHGDVDRGAELLDRLVAETRSEMQAALHQGADGLFYVLDGAHPAVTTPMEYGGHFLELDRQLLLEVQGARFNVLYVCGASEPYLDFVSDLPAHAFAWDSRSGASVADVRAVRKGAIAAVVEGADFRLVTNSGVAV